MTKRRATVIFIIGFSLAVGSCAPLGSSIYQTFVKRPALSVGEGASIAGEAIDLAPDRRARLVVALVVDTASVQEDLGDNGTDYHARYRFPLNYRIETPDGRVLIKQRSEVDWRDDTKDMSGRERQSSLIEENAKADAQGAELDVTAVFRSFEVPSDGKVRVTAALGEDDTYGAVARSVQFKVEHDLAINLATLVTSGVFMLFGGWIIAIVGFVMLLVTSTESNATEIAAMTTDLSTEEEGEVRKLAMFCHLAGLLGYVVPFGNVIGPLVMWMMNRERHPYIDEQGKEALNFQLSMLAYALLAFALVLVVIGFFLLPLLALFQIVMSIVAGLKAKEGEAYRYPLTFRLIR